MARAECSLTHGRQAKGKIGGIIVASVPDDTIFNLARYTRLSLPLRVKRVVDERAIGKTREKKRGRRATLAPLFRANRGECRGKHVPGHVRRKPEKHASPFAARISLSSVRTRFLPPSTTPSIQITPLIALASHAAARRRVRNGTAILSASYSSFKRACACCPASRSAQGTDR